MAFGLQALWLPLVGTSPWGQTPSATSFLPTPDTCFAKLPHEGPAWKVVYTNKSRDGGAPGSVDTADPESVCVGY